MSKKLSHLNEPNVEAEIVGEFSEAIAAFWKAEHGHQKQEAANSKEELGTVLSALTKEQSRIISVAKNRKLTIDQRLREISGIDSTYFLKTSKVLAEQLGCRRQAIEKTDWWNIDREDYRKREAQDRGTRLGDKVNTGRRKPTKRPE